MTACSRRPALAVFVLLVLFLGAAPLGAAPSEDLIGSLPLWASRTLDRERVVAIPGGGGGFVDAYADLRDDGLPAFITTDSVLHATAAVLDRTLLAIESGELYDRLEELSRQLVRLSEDQYLRASDPAVKEAARRNVAYFGVGLSLLDPDYYPSESARSLVERELSLIEEGKVTAFSPIMGPSPLDGVLGPGEDYTVYLPRGRYATDERLGRFYRAVTWYGRMAFALPEGRVEDYYLTLQGLLVVRAMESEAGEWLELWERVHDPLEFYYGDSGDPTVEDYIEIADDVLGDRFDIGLLADQDRVAKFVARVAAEAPPHFETHELRGMRFLERRFHPDTKIFFRLASSSRRELPTALDLMALLGSRAARAQLDNEDAFADDVYRLGFDEIQNEFDAKTYGDWTRDLQWSWLYALRAVTTGPPTGAPAFARGGAWDAKQLTTAAAAWALLRDPWGGSIGTAPPPSERPGTAAYVEPYPELYSRLRDLTEHTHDGLLEHYLLSPGIDVELSQYSVFLSSLERIARSELTPGGSPGTRKGLGDFAGTLSDLAAALDAHLPEAAERAASDLPFSEIAYNDPVSGRLLEVAVGYPDALYVAVSGSDTTAVYAGAALSFYEFERDTRAELAGERWPSVLSGGGAERPSWTARYLAR